MELAGISALAAFLAGMIAFFSPCVLPLVPIYLGYMTGTAVQELTGTRRLAALVHALAFVLGFGLLFVLLGATAGLVGHLLYPALPYLLKGGGLLLIVMGLHFMGVITIPWLNMEKRLEWRGQRKGYVSSFVIGLVFAAGWTPCVGPTLSAILLLAADSRTLGHGALLLAFYASGLGLPFLVLAGILDIARPVLQRAGRCLRAVSMVGGALLVLMGVLLLTGLWSQVVGWFNAWGYPIELP
jgi:cytochrome c-type biogenesis protein